MMRLVSMVNHWRVIIQCQLPLRFMLVPLVDDVQRLPDLRPLEGQLRANHVQRFQHLKGLADIILASLRLRGILPMVTEQERSRPRKHHRRQ